MLLIAVGLAEKLFIAGGPGWITVTATLAAVGLVEVMPEQVAV